MTNSRLRLGTNIVLTGRLLINKVNSLFQASGINITMEQLEILFHVVSHKEKRIIQNELADRMLKNKSAIVRSVDILEKKNFVKRIPVAGDRRKNMVELTPQGTSVLSKASRVFDRIKHTYTSTIEDNEIETCSRVLEEIKHAVADK